MKPGQGYQLVFLRPHLERLITLLRGERPVIGFTAIAIDLTGDRTMVPTKQFRDATSRILPAQLTGDRLPFLGAQRHAPTHQPSPPDHPPESGHLSRSKSATIKACRYDRLSPSGVW